jgi:hypothetical protein
VLPGASGVKSGVAASDPKSAAFTLRDTSLTLAARDALSRDVELGKCALGVHVHEGVAIIWGQVASPQLAERAVDLLRGVQGLHQVRSKLTIVPPSDMPTDRLPSRPPTFPAPAVAAARIEAPRAADMLPNREVGGRPRPGLPRREASEERRTVMLQPPLTLPDAPSSNLADPPAVLLTPQPRSPAATTSAPHGSAPAQLLSPKPAGPLRELQAHIEQVRQSDERFGRIEVQVRDRIVYLRGPSDALSRFADLVARVPFVELVVMEQLPPARPAR